MGIGYVIFTSTNKVYAVPTILQPEARVSFTFDDGYIGALNKAAPALAEYGYAGTSYVITNQIGKKGYMTWSQITNLKNAYHWEIGAHSVTHTPLTTVTASQLEKEVVSSKAALVARGFNPTSFATPFGDYNNQVIAAVARHYSSHRSFADVNARNIWPYNDYLLYVKQVQAGVTVEKIKTYIDDAKQKKAWLILVFHEISDKANPDPNEYEYSTADLKLIAEYIKTQNLPVVNMSSGRIAQVSNLLPNSTFDNGVTEGWTTDSNTNQVKKNTAGKGNHPSPENSIEFNAADTKAVHLFSPKVNIDATRSYLWKTYLNIEKRTSGDVTFYIDEYDNNGTWISGQYKKGEASIFVESMNLAYKPSSTAVKKAAVQISISAGSGIKAYVDNMQLFATN